jgi:hypothetical protein
MTEIISRECTVCKVIKSIDNFHKHASCKHGVNTVCKTCRKEQGKIHYKNSPFKAWASRSLRYHKEKGFIINLSIEQLISIGESTPHCSICGCKLSYERYTGFTTCSPTVDRFNNEHELNCENIWILCRDCNTMKGVLPMKEFVKKCQMIVNKFGGD